VHMCGFPLNQLDRHLKTLVQSCNRFVALCEEFPPTGAGEEFTRRVVRVITPGTLIDESFLNKCENNYLLSISSSGTGRFGLAWIDVSTGEFYSQSTMLECLRDDICRIGPREVILAKDSDGGIDPDVRNALADEASITTTIVDALDSSSDAAPLPAPGEQEIDPQDISAPLSYTGEELQAIRFLNSVLQSRLLEHMPILSSPIRQNVSARMQIDSHTIYALEIKEAMREGGTHGSLLNTIRRTVTSGGTRLLSRWLCESPVFIGHNHCLSSFIDKSNVLGSPSTSLDEIHARQSVVAVLQAMPHLRADLLQLLKQTRDVSRIVQRFILRKGDKEDLIAIKDAVHMWTLIQKRVSCEPEHVSSPSIGNGQMEDWGKLEALIGRMKDLMVLARHISDIIDEEAPGIVKMVGATDLASFGEPGDLNNGTQADKRQPIFTIRPRYAPARYPLVPTYRSF
jgi:DNA mismatch repair ATPase MutS